MSTLDIMMRQVATSTLVSSSTTTTTETAKYDPTNTIAPYATALNGVNQTVNFATTHALWGSLGLLAISILLIRLLGRFNNHLRHMTAMSMTRNQQGYFASVSRWWKVKKHVLYAPLWNKRHNREFQLSSVISMGTLPSRFHALLLVFYLLTNLAYCLILDFSRPNKYSLIAELRGRSGTLAVANMLPLVIFAGRNNPLIGWLQISFDTYNLLHRWIGRTIVLEALIHTCAWAYVKHAAAGWSGMGLAIRTDPFIGYGTVGAATLSMLFFFSPSPIRHAFYETFLDVHILLAAFTIACTYVHCHLSNLPQLVWVQAVICLWIFDRLARFGRIVYYNYSTSGWTTCTVVALPSEACRVTFHVPRHVDIKPGTHAYLRFACLNIWESHPFSIAWASPRSAFLSEELPYTEKTLPSSIFDTSSLPTDISFIISAQTGMTRRLYNAAIDSHVKQDKPLTIKAAFEGPYAGHHSLDSYGHCVLFAGSSGITHQLPYLKHLITSASLGTVATRRITLIWTIRDTSQLEWIRPWMDEILKLPGRRDILTVKIHVTKPKRAQEIKSQSETVQMYPGRPNFKILMREEIAVQTGKMCVTACGPGGMQDGIREAVREVMARGEVDFIEESFTW